jgi:hypothetical protein
VLSQHLSSGSHEVKPCAAGRESSPARSDPGPTSVQEHSVLCILEIRIQSLKEDAPKCDPMWPLSGGHCDVLPSCHKSPRYYDHAPRVEISET